MTVQIALMREKRLKCDIYSRAEEVIFWLGQATYETNVLMDSLKKLEQKSLENPSRNWRLADGRWNDLWLSVQPDLRQHPDLGTLQHKGLSHLLQEPWFRRVWILQEVANARRAVVCSGSRVISARIFALAPLFLHIRPEHHCQAVLDIMPGPSRKDSWWSKNRDLYRLLVSFRESKASNPRDMVYALLGISSDAQDIDCLRPDYTKDIQDVIRDTALFLFGHSVSFTTMESFIQRLPLENNATLRRIAERSDRAEVADYLMRRGFDIEITEYVVKATAANTKNGKEVIEFFLQQRGDEVQVTEEVVKAAARNSGSGKEIMELLLQQHGDKV
jgi:hypothetical protein